MRNLEHPEGGREAECVHSESGLRHAAPPEEGLECLQKVKNTPNLFVFEGIIFQFLNKSDCKVHALRISAYGEERVVIYKYTLHIYITCTYTS